MKVSISKSKGTYPKNVPFNPGINYPEYPLNEISDEENNVYDAVRNNFYQLGYDIENYNTPNWNPLGHIITPGETVFIKPNLVDHKHRFDEDIWSIITHPSVIRAVADYVAIALKGKGKIIIGDNPHVDTNFDILNEICYFKELQSFYRDKFQIDCDIIDLRFWNMPDLKYYGFKEGRVEIDGDPAGMCKMDIGKKSIFKGIHSFLFRGTYNDRFETIKHHILGKHQYIYSKSIVTADVYISIPKLKSHAKVGATLNLKGLVGTIANKNCLVHWRIGFPKFGGDEYPNPNKKRDYFKLYWQHLLIDLVPGKIYFNLRNYFNKRKIGKWYNNLIDIESQKKRMLRGAADLNDTTWRMTVDIYKAFVHDLSGYRDVNNCPYKGLSIIDGIIGGDTDGPHFPNKVNSNVIITGDSLLATDLVAVRLMDFDYNYIKYLQHLVNDELDNDLSKIKVLSEDFNTKDFFNPNNSYLGYRPPHKWNSISLKNLKPGKSFLPL